MSGRVYRVVPRQTFNFSMLGAGEDQGRNTAPMVPTVDYTDATLIVRVYERTIGAGNVKVAVAINATNDEDASAFIGKAITGSTVTIDANTDEQVLTADLTGSLGAAVAVYVTGEQGNTAGENLWVDISADLVLKGA